MLSQTGKLHDSVKCGIALCVRITSVTTLLRRVRICVGGQTGEGAGGEKEKGRKRQIDQSW